MTQQWQTGTVTVNGKTLHFDTTGVGQPVIFIHSGLTDRRLWDAQFTFAPFSEHFQLIRYDLPGHGQSDAVTQPFPPLDDLRLLMDHLGVEGVYLIGASLGGSLALEFTLAFPKRVGKLVLVGSDVRGYPTPPPDADTQALMEAIQGNKAPERVVEMLLATKLFDADPQLPESIAHLRGMLLENYAAWTSGSVSQLAHWHGVPALDRLPLITCPTLIVVGSRDVQEIRNIANLLEAGIATSTRRIIDGAAHHPNLERPAEFNAAVLEFLNQPSQ